MRARFVGNWRKLEKTALETVFTREGPQRENPVNIGFLWSRWSGLNRRPTVYETVALPLSYTGDARCANEPSNYGAGEGAASGKFDSHQFFRERGRVSVVRTGSCREFSRPGGEVGSEWTPLAANLGMDPVLLGETL